MRGCAVIVVLFSIFTQCWAQESIRTYQHYHRRPAEKGVFEHFFSPAYHPNDPDPFWVRTAKELPTISEWGSGLYEHPKHALVGPIQAMYRMGKSRFVDSISIRNSWEEVALDYIVAVPDMACVGANCVYDGVTNFGTESVAPVVPGVGLWGTKFLIDWTRPVSPVHTVLDVIPKSLYTIGLPAWKATRATGDLLQKAVNIPYELLAHPLDVVDHGVEFYFAPLPTPTPLPLGPAQFGRPAPDFSVYPE